MIEKTVLYGQVRGQRAHLDQVIRRADLGEGRHGGNVGITLPQGQRRLDPYAIHQSQGLVREHVEDLAEVLGQAAVHDHLQDRTAATEVLEMLDVIDERPYVVGQGVNVTPWVQADLQHVQAGSQLPHFARVEQQAIGRDAGHQTEIASVRDDIGPVRIGQGLAAIEDTGERPERRRLVQGAVPFSHRHLGTATVMRIEAVGAADVTGIGQHALDQRDAGGIASLEKVSII